MTREQILNIKNEMYNLYPNEDLDLIFSDLRPSPITDTMRPPNIGIDEIKDWDKRNTAPGVLRTALEYPFEKLASYDKQSMPSDWIGPTGSGGYASNWRHAGNTALLKNQIANAVSPYLGKTIGNIGGGLASFGGGLLHELTSQAPIWMDEKRTVDEALPFDVGPSKKLSPEFKSDILANLFGSWKGKTGIADTEVLESLLEDMSKEDAWSTTFANLLEEEEENKVPSRFDRNQFIPNWTRKFWEPEGRWVNPFRNEILDKQSWIKKMKERKKYEIPTLRSDTSNIIKGPGETPNVPGTPIVPTGDGRDFQPQRPTRPGGFTDPGKGSYGPWKADGGIVDLYNYGGF